MTQGETQPITHLLDPGLMNAWVRRGTHPLVGDIISWSLTRKGSCVPRYCGLVTKRRNVYEVHTDLHIPVSRDLRPARIQIYGDGRLVEDVIT